MDLSSNVSEIIWLVILVAFICGIILGVVAYHFLVKSKEETKLQTRIDTLESELDSYKTKVNDHFLTTAQLVNRLTEDYRHMHRHLASGADELCTSEAAQGQFQETLISTSSLLSGDEQGHDDAHLVDPPKDYVPKESLVNSNHPESSKNVSPS